jgi:hypothetical protein
MPNTPRLGAPEWAISQALPETTGNEIIRFVEQGAGFFVVKNKTLTAPPVSPAEGDAHIVAATATGAWTGHEKSIAFYMGGAWSFIVPIEGSHADCQADDTTYRYSGSAWAAATAAGSLLAANNLSDVASASTSRTNLGATDVGENVFTLADPSAITFIRINADNTVDTLDAAAFRAAIGAGTGSGGGDMLGANNLSDVANAATAGANIRPIESLGLACSDETTALAAGAAKLTFRMPYGFVLTAVRASLTTAQTSGSIFTVDINETGSTILSTKLTIDNTEKTSTTAAAPAVVSDANLADDAEMTIDIDQIGDGTAKGLKVYLIGHRA